MTDIECKSCGETFEDKSEACPKCGKKANKHMFILVFMLIFTVVLSCSTAVFN
jgi:uncharacterized OB-fold protein